MKKTILCGLAAVALCATSCCNNGCSADGDNAAVDKATQDSLSTIYGSNIGSYILADYLRFGEEHQNDQTRKDIIRGIQTVLAADASDGMLMGLQIGAQMLQELQQLEAQGITIDKTLVMNAFKQSFMRDSVDSEALRADSETFSAMISRIQSSREAANDAAAAAAPEAVDNEAAGKQFLNDAMAADSDIKVSQSGLGYKIINAGAGPAVTDKSLVTVHYTGRLIDGTVFDSSVERGEPVTFSPEGVVPGFGEGLKLLSKGGKATLYIPGNLAYGAKGVPQAGIGPNAMLIFDIEVLEVENAQ